MNAKKILAIGLGILGIALVAEACYVGLILTKASGKKENTPVPTSTSKTPAIGVPSADAKSPIKHTYLHPSQVKPEDIAAWEEAVRQNPQLLDKRCLLAQAYMLTLDQRDKAIPHLEALLQLKPDHPEIELIRFWHNMLKPKEAKAPDPKWQKMQKLNDISSMLKNKIRTLLHVPGKKQVEPSKDQKK